MLFLCFGDLARYIYIYIYILGVASRMVAGTCASKRGRYGQSAVTKGTAC